jgi:hypothetical protein
MLDLTIKVKNVQHPKEISGVKGITATGWTPVVGDEAMYRLRLQLWEQ